MRNQLKAAIAVEIVVLVIALGFSVFYVANNLYRTSHALDVLLVVLWVLVAAIGLLVFRSRTLVREEMVRRFYLSADGLYNHEIGYAPLSKLAPEHDTYELVMFAAEALAKMSYGFEVAVPPEGFEPKFMISSRTFNFHLVGDEEEPEYASVVIDQWKGVLYKVELVKSGNHSYTELGTFDNAKELARLLDNYEATFDAEEDVER